jgi:hypothetical protein
MNRPAIPSQPGDFSTGAVADGVPFGFPDKE